MIIINKKVKMIASQPGLAHPSHTSRASEGSQTV